MNNERVSDPSACHLLPPRGLVFTLDLALAPKRSCACASHIKRLRLDLSFLHVFSAFASFCAFVNGLALGFAGAGAGTTGVGFPGPDSVALAGALGADGGGDTVG